MHRREMLMVASAASIGLAGCTTVQDRIGDLRRSPPERRIASDWRPGTGTWAEREYGPAKRRQNPHASPPRTEPTVDWHHDIDTAHPDGGLVVADDMVYLTTQRRLLAVDAADGRIQWEHRIAGPAGLKFVDGRLYQLNWALQAPDLVARSPGGEERWRTTVPDQLRGVHEQDGYVFVAGRDRYWTLHADSGEIVRERDEWTRNMASAGDGVYAAFSGILVRYEVAGRTLEERWRAQSQSPTESTHPVVAGDLIYVLQYQPTVADGEVLVYDSAGQRRHRIDLGYRPRYLTVTEDGPVIVPSDRGTLRAIRPGGSHRWTANVDGRAGAIATDDTIYAGNPLVALDDESGERLWKQERIDGILHLAAVDSTLYVATHDRLLALRE